MSKADPGLNKKEKLFDKFVEHIGLFRHFLFETVRIETDIFLMIEIGFNNIEWLIPVLNVGIPFAYSVRP